jgi:hypothetical protein
MVSIATIAGLPTCANIWSSCKGAYAKAFARSALLLASMQCADNIKFSLIALLKPQLALDTRHPQYAIEKKREK